MPLSGESAAAVLEQGASLQVDPSPRNPGLRRWRRMAIGGAALVVTVTGAACGSEDEAPNDPDIELAPDNGESAAAADDQTVTPDTLETLDQLAEDSPLDHLEPYVDRIEDQDASLVANTFLARANQFWQTGRVDDLKKFGIVARDNAQSIEDHENPVSMVPDEDATWGWYWSEHDESAVVVLVSGSVDITYGESDQFYAGETHTIGPEGFLIAVHWIPDDKGSYFGRFETSSESLLDSDPGIVALDQAPPEVAGAPIEETTTTTTVQEAPSTTEAPETGQPMGTDGLPLPPLAPGEIYVDGNQFMWEGQVNGIPINLGQGA